MAKVPKDPKEIFQEIVDDYKGIYGDDLVSIILYGSAVGKDYLPGKSDINFMIVLSEEGIDDLDRAFKSIRKWHRRKVATPLFLTKFYVESSTDVFPIEYLGFQHRHTLVYGEDILKDLTFKKELLRIQCEREIKGKLLLLRESFIESGGRGGILKDLIKDSMKAFLALFDALLYLKGMDIPEEKRQKIGAACEIFEMNMELFNRLLDIGEQKIKVKDSELPGMFKEYLREIRGLSRIVDELGGQDDTA